MLAHAGPEWRVPRPLGIPPKVDNHVARLEVCGSKHWPIPSETRLRCRVCKARGVTKKKCSGSAVSVKWDCPLRILVLKITTQRHSSNNITCDLLNKNCGIKPKETEIFAYSIQFFCLFIN